jgi:RimJ/RimL family protein N-acetyltransferase
VPSLIAPALPPGTLAALPQPELPGDGLLLRPWQPTDLPTVLAGYADPVIQHWHCRTMTADEARDWICAWGPRWQAETGAGWAVVEDGAVVGQISLRHIHLTDAAGEISYWVLPAARGRRVAPRALAALTDWSFDQLGLHRLEVCHSTRNRASCQVATRAGFAVEGTKRGEFRHADGWHDMHYHARLADDR